MSIRKYEIEYDGNKYKYQISTLNAMAWVDLFMNITSCIVSTDKFKAENIISVLQTIAQTGMQTNTSSTADKAEIDQITQELATNRIMFAYDIFRNMFTNMSLEQRNNIINAAISCVSIENGAAGLMQLNYDNINTSVPNPMYVLDLVKESLIHNFEPVMKRFFSTAEPSTE